MKALVSLGSWKKEINIKPQQLRGGELGVILDPPQVSKIRTAVILQHTGFANGMPVFECK